MKLNPSLCSLAMILSLAMPGAAMADVTDAVGDWAPSYTGPKTPDLDVISSAVSYDPGTHMFTLTGTMAGNIVPGSGAAYVWGFNRGSATNAPFADARNVIFDVAASLRADGTGSLSGNALAVTINGATISASFSDALLPATTAGVSFAGYTWNLWPRFNGAVPDFAPDNAMAAVQVVPEPGTWALMAAGLGVLVRLRRRS